MEGVDFIAKQFVVSRVLASIPKYAIKWSLPCWGMACDFQGYQPNGLLGTGPAAARSRHFCGSGRGSSRWGQTAWLWVGGWRARGRQNLKHNMERAKQKQRAHVRGDMTGTDRGWDKERQSSQRDGNGNARERNWIRKAKGEGKTVRRRKAERQKHRNSGGQI